MAAACGEPAAAIDGGGTADGRAPIDALATPDGAAIDAAIIDAAAIDAAAIDAPPPDAVAIDAPLPIDASPPIDAPPVDAPLPDAPPIDASQPIVTSKTSTPNLTIVDDQYIGANDGDDGFGTDAGMVCDTIAVTAVPMSHTVQNVSVSVGISHTWVGDLTVKLRSPSGTVLALLERPQGDHGANNTGDTGQNGPSGDSSDLDGTPIGFGDGKPHDAETLGGGINANLAVCTDDGHCAFTPNPDQAALAGLSVADFAGFIGDAAAGDWTLCVADSSPGDVGTFHTWSLALISQ